MAVPLIAERGSGQKSGLNTEQSTLNILANEFKKLNPPKLQKLKGGTSLSAQLFFLGWVKELKAIIKDLDLTDSESIQLVREFTESKARQQVDFYLDTSPIQNVEGLLEHLKQHSPQEKMKRVSNQNFTAESNYQRRQRMSSQKHFKS